MSVDIPFPGTPDRANEEHEQVERHQLLSRTIAILAGVACNTHRLAIQTRITQNGFSILSERVEEWSLESDQDFLKEFLKDENKQMEWMQRLTGSPIYVMILERHRAAEIWLDLCGPDLEGEEEVLDEDGLLLTKTGLRASYGAGSLYGSSTVNAPRQIAICFPDLASIEAVAALNEETQAPNTHAAVGSDGGFLLREDEDILYDEDGKAFDAHNGEPIEIQHEVVVNVQSPTANKTEGSRVFKARPLPSNKQPTIKPRLSKAAALRMGVALPEPPKRAMSNSSSNDASLGISGLPRAGHVVPKSLMAPSIAPRLNRVAAARTKTLSSPEAVPKVMERERKEIDYSNVPGHKRLSMSSARPASLAAPAVAPRLNKAAAARLSGANNKADNGIEKGTGSFRSSQSNGKVDAVPSSTRTSSIDYSNTPGHKRMSLPAGSIKSLQAPSLAPRSNRASQARNSVGVPVNKAPSNAAAAKTVNVAERGGKENLFVNTPGHKRASSSFTIASLAQPSIAPRSNASAMKRLSIGGVGNNATAGGPPRPRPASVVGSSTPSKTTATASKVVARPSSRTSTSSAHQDGVLPRTTIRSNAAPPSSFKF